jgi:hypothetical protein
VKPQLPDGQSDLNPANAESCYVCRELLANLGRFVEIIETTRASFRSEWLTVEEIAQELNPTSRIRVGFGFF